MAFDETQEPVGRTVVGMFRSRGDAEAAIRELREAGFSQDEIGIAMQETDRKEASEDLGGSPVAEGAATGAVSGGIVGGLIGLLGSLLVPGLGPIVVGGVLASTLTGVGIGAAAGGLIGALIGMGVPEEDARHFDLGLRSGGILVTVDAGARTPQALEILERHQADFGPSGAGRYRRMPSATSAAPGEAGTPGLAGAGAGSAAARGDVYTPGAGAGIEGTGVGIGSADVASGSSTGTRGMEARRAWRGEERRRYNDPNYAGPERRLVTA